MYAVVFPLGACVFAMLSVYFYPARFIQTDSLAALVFTSVDYLLSLFTLFFCLLLLRRIFKRAFAFLMHMPVPLKCFKRHKYVLPLVFAATVLSYLGWHMFAHTLTGLIVMAFWELWSKIRVAKRTAKHL